MNIIDFEEFVSFVIEETSVSPIRVNGRMITEVQHELLHSGIACDFSPGAIETFAYHYPQNVKIFPFEIEICLNEEFTHKLCKIRPSNKELQTIIFPVWKRVKR